MLTDLLRGERDTCENREGSDKKIETLNQIVFNKPHFALANLTKVSVGQLLEQAGLFIA